MRSLVGMTIVTLLALMALPSSALAQDAPADVVQKHLAAYNARQVEATLATYAENAQLIEFPSKVLAEGLAALRVRYVTRFTETNLHAAAEPFVVMGDTVVVKVTITRTFPEGTGRQQLIEIYEVRGGKITRQWLILGPKELDGAAPHQ